MELDRIYITGLTLRCLIGINPEERVKKQDIIINLTLHADLSQASASDDIAHTVDYKVLKDRIIASSFYLIERLAQEACSLALSDPRVKRADVRIDKPGALRFAKSVAIELSRTQA
jgi:D-erythro-7,8-dihydroneopterin triphosphate epimerase